MKNIKALLALFAIIVLPVSCSSDGESSDGRDNSIRQRVVSKITFYPEEWDEADEAYSFRYDSYGRITRVTHKIISDSNAELCHYEHFVYGSNGILTIRNDDEDYSCEATLNRDGYISEMYVDLDGVPALYTFSYDKSGRLITNEYSCEYSYDDYYQNTQTYNWNSGNIVECEWYETDSDDYELIQYSYNSKLMNMVNLDLNVALGYYCGFLCIDFDICGYWGDGLCGQKSRNLLTSVEIFEGYGSYRYDINWHYDEDGYPVSADIIGDDDDDSCRVTIEYDDK